MLHASFGASGMAGSDVRSFAASKNFKLVAVAEVDQSRLAALTKQFPDVRVYEDWRVLLDKEKALNSVNVSTPDHMHGPIAMSAMSRGLHVYCQKPLTQTIHEARQLTRAAADKKLVTQMGIQIHSHAIHKTVVALIQSGAVGKVKEVHSWSGKQWGDLNPRPARTDPTPAGLKWDLWLGVAAGAALHRQVLPPRQLAEAARLRHRHLRRHGLPHPRPGVRLAAADQSAHGAVRTARPQRRQLGARRAGAASSSRARNRRLKRWP